LAAAILVIHRTPPKRRAYRIVVGIGFNLISIVITATRALVSVDAHRVIDRPASPHTVFTPTNPTCNLFDVRAARRYKLTRCARNRTGVRVRSRCCQNENRGRTWQPKFSCHDDLLCCGKSIGWRGARFARHTRRVSSADVDPGLPAQGGKRDLESYRKVQTK